jgi:hypothetical protein
MKHPQAELIKQLLDDMSLQVWHWETNQCKWISTKANRLFDYPNLVYVVGDEPTSPPIKMCDLAGIKFPMPLVDATVMNVGQMYWILEFRQREDVIGKEWAGDDYDYRSVRLGKAHFTRDGATQQNTAIQTMIKQAIMEAK